MRFSALTNMRWFFSTERPEGYIKTIDFLRFVSFGWLVFGHTWLFGPLYNESWCIGENIPVLCLYSDILHVLIGTY